MAHLTPIEKFRDSFLCPKSIDLFSFINDIPELFPLLHCQQDPEWHAEGSVLTHTNMALSEVWHSLSSFTTSCDKTSLYLATFLHDIGKPETTFRNETNGHLVAYGHEFHGAHLTRSFLRKYFPMLSFTQREEIVALVEYHGHPKKLITTNSDSRRFKRLSREVDLKKLYHLELADFRGRRGLSVDQNVSVIEAFKDRCVKLGIFEMPYTPENLNNLPKSIHFALYWNLFFKDKLEKNLEIDAIFNKFMTKPCVLTLLLGIPGSGKTTYRASYNGKVICLDEERKRLLGNENDMSKNTEVFHNCFRELKKSFDKRENVLWDATNYNFKNRRPLIEAAVNNGIQVQMVYFDTPLEVALERNRNRKKVVPDEVVLGFYKRLQVPKVYEYSTLTVV